MKLLEIRNQIIDFFQCKDTFLPEDLGKIKVPGEQEPVKKNLVEAAMNLLEEVKMVKSFRINDKEIGYVLEQSFGSDGQEVKIGLGTASIVSEIINSCRQANKIDGYVCNRMNITEEDIQSLCVICFGLLGKIAK